ncbi:helix-turn-helix domain-containing protein [Chryseolinea sp. H1M3-3]|uniref:winged helix-turn-helix transcriptional regulator n=1 Tax=Chryseolinea sp. H1M3-3 TaxID=3034144 RepID=UPI0023ED2B40|nr:helix-turn-helix domain-containing protein [Chryseolinea sp. H1M3-3]
MYKRKKKEDLDCGLYVTMKIFGAKWKPCIIDAIARGAKRPSEIHKQITSTSPRVLDMQLKELLDFGVVARTNQSGYPLYVEYYLTPFGESILPVLAQMAQWGETHKEFVKQQMAMVLEGSDENPVTTSHDTKGNFRRNDVEMISIC